MQHRVQTEAEHAAKNNLPPTQNIVAGDTNAALFPGDVQRHATNKDQMPQDFADTMGLASTDNNTSQHRQYTFRHRTDSNQDSRLDDILISKRLCMPIKPITSILHACGDSDHDPVLAQILLASISFPKPGLEPPPLPREAMTLNASTTSRPGCIQTGV